jgi:hypothetical protein
MSVLSAFSLMFCFENVPSNYHQISLSKRMVSEADESTTKGGFALDGKSSITKY